MVTTPGVTVLLTQLAKLIYRRTSEERLGMRVKEFAALVTLRDHSPIPQQELGEVLFVDANNLVLLLNELEAREFALRRRTTGRAFSPGSCRCSASARCSRRPRVRPNRRCWRFAGMSTRGSTPIVSAPPILRSRKKSYAFCRGCTGCCCRSI